MMTFFNLVLKVTILKLTHFHSFLLVLYITFQISITDSDLNRGKYFEIGNKFFPSQQKEIPVEW